jgi:hypothetical protein
MVAGPSPDAWPVDFAAAEYFGSGLLPPDYLPPECVPPETEASTSSLPPPTVSVPPPTVSVPLPSVAARRYQRRPDHRLQLYLLAGCGGLTLLLIAVVVVATQDRGAQPKPTAAPIQGLTNRAAAGSTSAVPSPGPVFSERGPQAGPTLGPPPVPPPSPSPDPSRMPPPVPAGGNFVELQVSGGSPRPFADLRSAIESAPNNAELLLRGVNLWRSGPLEIRGKSLRIRAASPHEGRILFVRDANYAGPLLRTDSPLTLEGLTLIDAGVGAKPIPPFKTGLNSNEFSPDEFRPNEFRPNEFRPNGLGGVGLRPPPEDGVVVAVGARLSLHACRIGTSRAAAGVLIYGGDQVELRQCQIAAPTGIGVACRESLSRVDRRPSVVRLENVTNLARVGLMFEVRTNMRREFVITNGLFLGESAVHLELARFDENFAAEPATTVDSRQAVFDCDYLMTAWTRVAEGPKERMRAAEDLPRRVAWRGESNRLQPHIKLLTLKPWVRYSSTGSGPPPAGAAIVADLEAWRRFWQTAEGNTQPLELRYGPTRSTRVNLPTPVPVASLEPLQSEDSERWIERLERSTGLLPAAEIAPR